MHFFTDNKIYLQATNETNTETLKKDWDAVYAAETATLQTSIDVTTGSKFKATLTFDKLSGGDNDEYTSLLSIVDTVKFANWTTAWDSGA